MSWYCQSQSAEVIERIEQGKTQEITPEEFLEYHQTGTIPSTVYRDYETLKGLSWLGTKEKYPILLKKQDFVCEFIEFFVMAANKYYNDVPFEVLASGNPMSLRQYINPAL